MIQLHKFLIGLVFVGIIVAGMMSFISSGVTTYAPDDYNNETFESFNKLSELSAQMEEFKGEEKNTTISSTNFFDELTQPFDIVGNFFTGMYQSAKVFMASTDLMTTMIDESVTAVPVGDGFGKVLKTGFSLIVLIIVFVGIFLAFVTKSERT